MSRLGFKSVIVYHGESCLGELDTVPVKDKQFQFPNNEIRIHHLSPISERCLPLSILQTISSFSVCCKLESNSPIEHAQLINLHASCFHELKTAVVLLGDEEVHLVAMPSKLKKFPCFWCCSVPSGLYNSCLGMLNMRCLAIVFDLDETLLVANTRKSFEDRIDTLTGWIARESDPIRVSGMTSKLKRYMEDRALLKQYIESDCVMDNGKVFNVQLEEVPLKSAVASFDKVVRPVIRLREKGLVLTRINPEIRDTSVLVRLRPAWEDLKTYLIAKGRKRFEVYVCTMAERDYALEMWRLLDPEAHLINSKQLLERVVCVKSGGRKSLQNVFQDGSCHPRMAMVIDDRLKVWEDKDQPRVHVVPAFTPYYAPQAETANAVPILCVARNVACNVRGGFFRDFDENLLRMISELSYEDEALNLPPALDASNYLISEDASYVPNGNGIGIGNAPIAERMHGPEVVHRLNQLDEKNIKDSVTISITNGLEMKADLSQSSVATPPTIFIQSALKPVAPSDKPSLLGAPFRRDNNFSEADQDFKRRFPMMNHTPDSRYRASAELPLIPRLPLLPQVPPIQPQGRWTLDEVNRRRLNNRTPSTVQGSDVLRPETQRSFHNHISRGPVAYASSRVQPHAPEVKIEEPYPGFGVQKRSHPASNTSGPDVGVYQNQSSFNNRERSTDNGKLLLPPSLSIGVLQEIAHRCFSKVEFRSIVSTSEHLQFSVEVLFSGDKIGIGMGKTRKDAQQQAAENALRCLADKYVSYVISCSGAVNEVIDKASPGVENGFLWETVDPGSDESLVKEGPKESTSEADEVTKGRSTNLGNQPGQKRASSPRGATQKVIEKRRKEILGDGHVSCYKLRRAEVKTNPDDHTGNNMRDYVASVRRLERDGPTHMARREVIRTQAATEATLGVAGLIESPRKVPEIGREETENHPTVRKNTRRGRGKNRKARREVIRRQAATEATLGVTGLIESPRRVPEIGREETEIHPMVRKNTRRGRGKNRKAGKGTSTDG